MNHYDLSSEKRATEALSWQNKTGNPQKSLKLIAVTGTNGKTSVSTLLTDILRKSGEKTGLIGTVSCSDGVTATSSAYTTPPPAILYPLLAEMVKNGVTTVIMEASSHALSQERLFGLTFDLAIFTNLTRDHLDYHGTRDAYLAAKAKLFTMARSALINADDPAAREIAFHAAGDVYYCSTKDGNAEFLMAHPLCTENGISLSLHTMCEKIYLQAPLFGGFHLYNLAQAAAAAHLLGVSGEEIEKTALSLRAPLGRLEKLADTGDISVFIDYAHTPDALEKALLTLRPHAERLTVLFGAGGDRDHGKRAEMGRIAELYADFAIVTDDNPRNEAPEDIRSDILSGMKKENHVTLPNRKDAITHAVLNAVRGETILLAGKGHEEYIIDRHGRHDFSERKIVSDAIERRKIHHKGS